jgi:putative hemolysin
MLLAHTESHAPKHIPPSGVVLASDSRYEARFAETEEEVLSVLRLRFEVFSVELAGKEAQDGALEWDQFDSRSRHLMVIEKSTGATVGTYRVNAVASHADVAGLYSYGEFTLEDLPNEIVENGIEIGRACIARDHRNSKVLFLLWKALAAHLMRTGRRYFFGCCSIFTRDREVAELAYRQLGKNGNFDEKIKLEPRRNGLYKVEPRNLCESEVRLPSLFELYLKLGAKVCGPPTIDEEFGTVDFFVICDSHSVTERYRNMFFTELTPQSATS